MENKRKETRGLQILIIILFQFSIIHSRDVQVVGIQFHPNTVQYLHSIINY
ncbi:MAG: hypothetical protein LBG27_04765 [Spirochaetaceae bacterium]|nr:hypothetical protein [Spirochaetaceae bacterium]